MKKGEDKMCEKVYSIDEIKKICEFFDMSFEYLFEEKEDQKEKVA